MNKKIIIACFLALAYNITQTSAPESPDNQEGGAPSSASLNAVAALLQDKQTAQQAERLLVSLSDASKKMEQAAQHVGRINMVQAAAASASLNQATANVNSTVSKVIGGTIATIGAVQMMHYGVTDVGSLLLLSGGLAVGDFPNINAAGRFVKENWRRPINNVNWNWVLSPFKRCFDKKNHKK